MHQRYKPLQLYVSFCGTDSTTLGWKEDFNMAYLDIVPSEIEAIQYLKDVSYNFIFKKLYVGGHSKGGRLAITAAKRLNRNYKLLGLPQAVPAVLQSKI